MRTMNVSSFVRRALNDQLGQALPFASILILSLLGMAGLSVDVGQAYVVKAQLQSSANAAVLSAVENMYDNGITDNANYLATSYSAGANHFNASVTNVTVTPTVTTPCLNYLMPGNTGCTNTNGNASGSSVPNAVKIVQTATVPTYFMRIFGKTSLTVSATAQASIGSPKPWNVAIILDTTPSMGSVDPKCTTANTTAEQCAMSGIQTMLSGIPPCKGLTACTSADSNALFRVALFAFPNVDTATVAEDYKCTGTPNEVAYTLPPIPPAPTTGTTPPGYAPITYTGSTKETATYQILTNGADSANIDANGFTSDYYDATTSTKLRAASLLVKAVGNGSTKGCLKPPTGFSGNQTYFASSIYAAQAALLAEQAAVTNLGITSNNAIIFVSDGQANVLYDKFPQATSTVTAASAGTGINVTYKGSSSKNLTGNASTFGTYPDYNDDCQQAIQAAQYAKTLGTRMYGVAYYSEANGCVTDNNVVSFTGTLNSPITQASQVIPCTVMQDIASPGETSADPWYFYTDGESIANGCKDTSHTSSDLASIFNAITSTFVMPRLLPNDVN